MQDGTIEVRERQKERRRSFAIFFSIVLAVYGSINYYIYVRLMDAVPDGSRLRELLPPIFLFVVACYLVGQFLERKRSSWLSDGLTWVGAFWLGAMTWFFLAAVLVDLVRLLDLIFNFLPVIGVSAKAAIGLAISGVVAVAMFLGFLNARNIRVKPLKITIDKPGTPLRIAAISDMHMGSLIGRRMVRQMVRKLNTLDADLVLMIGDQVDGNPHPVMQLDLGAELKQIRSRYGVFAITGNHEYIGNAETSCAYLEAHGITMLRDAVTEVAGVYLVGREDIAAKQFANVERKSLEELVSRVDRSKPIILMDHTPFHLEQAEQSGIDLQLSGHTHHAQIWPWHFIAKRVYEVSWGYKRKGDTHVYVSCGAGTWGPPVRIGNTPEIMDITIEFSGV